jgi:hypothetical protein
MFKSLVILVLLWWLVWFVRRAWKSLLGASVAGRRPENPDRRTQADRKPDLSRQEISDADYEELP